MKKCWDCGGEFGGWRYWFHTCPIRAEFEKEFRAETAWVCLDCREEIHYIGKSVVAEERKHLNHVVVWSRGWAKRGRA